MISTTTISLQLIHQFTNYFLFLRSDPQQRHGDNDEEEVDGFGLDVLLFEKYPAAQEAHEDAGTTDKRGD